LWKVANKQKKKTEKNKPGERLPIVRKANFDSQAVMNSEI